MLVFSTRRQLFGNTEGVRVRGILEASIVIHSFTIARGERGGAVAGGMKSKVRRGNLLGSVITANI